MGTHTGYKTPIYTPMLQHGNERQNIYNDPSFTITNISKRLKYDNKKGIKMS